jgi:hypothetical protein
MKPLDIRTFDIANLPAGVARFTDAKAAFQSVRDGTTRIALVDMQAQFAALDENQRQNVLRTLWRGRKFCSWRKLNDKKHEPTFNTLGATLAVSLGQYFKTASHLLGKVDKTAGFHVDGPRIVAIILRKHNGTIFFAPDVSDAIGGARIEQHAGVLDITDANDWLDDDKAPAFIPPKGYAVIFAGGKLVHASPFLKTAKRPVPKGLFKARDKAFMWARLL